MPSAESADDITLARLAQGGSAAAFGELVHRHHERVFGFLLGLTRHRQDAEDLTQETFLRAWDKIHRFDASLPILPWLLTIARRQSIAALRRKRPLPAEAPVYENEAPDSTHRLWRLAKSRLSPDAFSALWLHYREELSLAEVAAVLGKREGAVKVMLHRARLTLANHAKTPPPLPASLPPPLPQARSFMS